MAYTSLRVTDTACLRAVHCTVCMSGNTKYGALVYIFAGFTEANRHVFQDTNANGPGYYRTFYVDPSDDNSIYIGAL